MRIVKPYIIGVAVLATVAALAWAFLVPLAIERALHERLARAGFADARFSVGDVGLDRVELLDVTLAPGLELGDIDVERGPYDLWRGKPADVVLHGLRIDARSVPRRGSGKKSPLGRVVVEDGELQVGSERIAVRGSIDLRGRAPRVDLVARSPRIAVGAVRVEDAVATIRGPRDNLRVCGTGRVERTLLDACMQVKGSQIEAGVARVTMPAHAVGDVAIAGGALRAEFSGDLDARTFAVRGELRASRVTARQVEVEDATLAFDVTAAVEGGRLRVRSERELVLAAAGATVTARGESLRVDAPRVTARGTQRLGAVELTAGAPAKKLELVTTLRGIPLDRILAAATRDRARGTGVLDGQLVFELDDDKLALTGGKLAARRPGHIAVPALALKGADTTLALHKRIGAALSDFDYAKLSLTVAANPDLRVALVGRGRRVRQALDIAINVRGLR